MKGPVKASSASGYVHVYSVERDVQVSAASGSIEIIRDWWVCAGKQRIR